MKWSQYMSSNQQILTIGSIGLKSDYREVKISLTTGLGSYPDNQYDAVIPWLPETPAGRYRIMLRKNADAAQISISAVKTATLNALKRAAVATSSAYRTIMFLHTALNILSDDVGVEHELEGHPLPVPDLLALPDLEQLINGLTRQGNQEPLCGIQSIGISQERH